MQKRPAYKGVVPEGKKYCPECKNVLDIQDFTSKTGKVHGYCHLCANAMERRKHSGENGRKILRDKNLRHNYKNFSLVDYDAMFLAQCGACAVCGQPEIAINPRTKAIQSLHVDHNHETDKVRALLCQDCNIAFGQLREDPERIRLLLLYAEKVKAQET